MISSTRTSEARRSSAATPQHTSRSVTTPASLAFSAPSTTGAQPHPESRIVCAAFAAVSCGVQHDDGSIGFITSLQQDIVFAPLIADIRINHAENESQDQKHDQHIKKTG
ncbi:MAG TPA: hypothetical protein VNA69_01950 [Thermoanaerobaculia bacterium]|nr:hypothetical protein [Thermoanaerobaculia bacterium]